MTHSYLFRIILTEQYDTVVRDELIVPHYYLPVFDNREIAMWINYL